MQTIKSNIKLTVLKKILTFFSNEKPNDALQISEESKNPFDFKYEDLGKFGYDDDGFTIDFTSGPLKIFWTDIEQLIAYKQDMFTYDEVCIDIKYNDLVITISEATPGWYQFIIKTKQVFPSISATWDIDIVHPAFETNLTILYQRDQNGSHAAKHVE